MAESSKTDLSGTQFVRFSGDDYQEMTDLLHSAYRELLELGLRFTATSQPVETTKRRCEEGETWVALQDGRMVGTITLVLEAKDWCPDRYHLPHVCYFTQFGVDPSLRGLGIGRKLLELAEARGMDDGKEEICLDTAEPAQHLISLYERWGYQVVERFNWGGSQINYGSVIMSKSLRA